ncbi:hypothetical protein OG568_58860 (plasmid) [Streptomyces sp. NBC_01450]|uniref:hypothetical protein n=1 Tax=Streptomyces sp. NBC_01450 TaxID=2903871 RepID=UPI002E2ED1A7|nr:hypothetical protein [Streptomyces sp. NBC_01450]
MRNPGRARRELAKEFDLSDHLNYPDRFLALLDRVWTWATTCAAPGTLLLEPCETTSHAT